jgi:hypothetical protein
MPRYNLSDPTDWDAAIREFLDAHPTLQAESNAVAEHSGIEETWLSTVGMIEFFDWARQQHYISGSEARLAITRMRALANTHYNQRQHEGEA